ncbi:hypothetical protein PAHAL_5G274100 [Panicum hallii]|uniref:Uncharacterized protein n=2 Tax=Panicum hallii TaxID=206008 RepID=A0A2T8ILF2_9POAL|nr:hypothetical protein PAHAL_5G274100 [Panicum hallii]
MLRRRREQRTYVGKELLVLQVPILFKRTTPTRTRKSHRRTNQRLRRQPLLRRRRRRELAMCAVVRITLLQSVRTAKATTPPTWLLASLEEHRDRRDFLLADGERITCACSWCWYGKSEVYFGEDRAAEERAACPHHQEEFSQRLSTV